MSTKDKSKYDTEVQDPLIENAVQNARKAIAEIRRIQRLLNNLQRTSNILLGAAGISSIGGGASSNKELWAGDVMKRALENAGLSIKEWKKLSSLNKNFLDIEGKWAEWKKIYAKTENEISFLKNEAKWMGRLSKVLFTASFALALFQLFLVEWEKWQAVEREKEREKERQRDRREMIKLIDEKFSQIRNGYSSVTSR